MENKELVFNYSECIKQYSSWGTTHYVNICNGEKHDVNWGVGEYFCIFLILVLIAALVSLPILLFRIVTDEF